MKPMRETTMTTSTSSNIAVIKLIELEGSVLTDGDNGLAIRHTHLEPALATDARIVVDFRGIEAATPSWINAFLGGAILDHGKVILRRISFISCAEAVKQSIRMVVSISGSEADLRLKAAI